MMIRYAFLLILFGGLPAFAAGNDCTISNDVFESRGKKVYLNFVPHRTSEQVSALNALADHPQIVTKDLIAAMKRYYVRIEPEMHLNDQLKDAKRLQNLVEHKQVSWVGVERSPAELEERDEKGLGGEDYFRKLAVVFGAAGADQAFVDKIQLLWAGSPARYVGLKNKDVRSVALDSNELKVRGRELLDQSQTYEDVVNSVPKRRPALNAEAKRVIEKIRKDEKDWAEMSDAEIETFTDRISDRELKWASSKALRSNRDFIRNQKARDAFAAGIILNQEGNGWLSEGTSHYRLKETLKASCLKATGEGSSPDTPAGAAAK